MVKINKKGSALLWAIAVIMILEVTVAASLGLAQSYYNRSVINHEKRQAYQTAKGVIQDIVKNINLDNEKYLKMFEDLEVGDKRELKIAIPSTALIGEISQSWVEMKEEKSGDNNTTYPVLTIAVVAKYQDQQELVKADMKKGGTDVQGVNTWQLIKYYREDYVLKESINITNAKKLFGEAYPYLTASKEGQTALKELMKTDSRYATVISTEEGQKLMSGWMSGNSSIRNFFMLRNNPNKAWDNTFDFSVVENQEKADELIRLANGKPYNIQFFIPDNDYSQLYIYASTQTESNSGWGSVRLIYDTESGHWYYLSGAINETLFNPSGIANRKEGLMMTSFNSVKANSSQGIEAKSSKQIWEDFRKYYILQEYDHDAIKIVPGIKID